MIFKYFKRELLAPLFGILLSTISFARLSVAQDRSLYVMGSKVAKAEQVFQNQGVPSSYMGTVIVLDEAFWSISNPYISTSTALVPLPKSLSLNVYDGAVMGPTIWGVEVSKCLQSLNSFMSLEDAQGNVPGLYYEISAKGVAKYDIGHGYYSFTPTSISKCKVSAAPTPTPTPSAK